jgi:hypothetical protein
MSLRMRCPLALLLPCFLRLLPCFLLLLKQELQLLARDEVLSDHGGIQHIVHVFLLRVVVAAVRQMPLELQQARLFALARLAMPQANPSLVKHNTSQTAIIDGNCKLADQPTSDYCTSLNLSNGWAEVACAIIAGGQIDRHTCTAKEWSAGMYCEHSNRRTLALFQRALLDIPSGNQIVVVGVYSSHRKLVLLLLPRPQIKSLGTLKC